MYSEGWYIAYPAEGKRTTRGAENAPEGWRCALLSVPPEAATDAEARVHNKKGIVSAAGGAPAAWKTWVSLNRWCKSRSWAAAGRRHAVAMAPFFAPTASLFLGFELNFLEKMKQQKGTKKKKECNVKNKRAISHRCARQGSSGMVVAGKDWTAARLRSPIGERDSSPLFHSLWISLEGGRKREKKHVLPSL